MTFPSRLYGEKQPRLIILLTDRTPPVGIKSHIQKMRLEEPRMGSTSIELQVTKNVDDEYMIGIAAVMNA